MSLHTRWYIEDRVIWQTYYGDITDQDALTAARFIEEFAKTAPPGNTVHLIADLTRVSQIRFHLTFLKKCNFNIFRPGGWVVPVIGNNTPIRYFIRAMHRPLEKILNIQIHVATTWEDAEAFLASQEADLQAAFDRRNRQSGSAAAG